MLPTVMTHCHNGDGQKDGTKNGPFLGRIVIVLLMIQLKLRRKASLLTEV